MRLQVLQYRLDLWHHFGRDDNSWCIRDDPEKIAEFQCWHKKATTLFPKLASLTSDKFLTSITVEPMNVRRANLLAYFERDRLASYALTELWNLDHVFLGILFMFCIAHLK
jgi:hypothetical protein